MNWNDVKKLDKKELLEMVPQGFKFSKPEPWKHQIACFLTTIASFEINGDGFLNCLDMGTGKTRIAIDIVRYFDYIAPPKKYCNVLVVCLNSAVENWRDEVYKFSDKQAFCLRGSKAEKEKILDEKCPGFYIVNFEGLRALLTEKNDNYIKGGRSKKTKISNSALLKLKNKFDFLIIDESHKLKSSTSLNFQMVSQLARHIEKRLLLTGTPFGNSLLDIWSQYYIIDFGNTFFNKESKYRLSYFENQKKYFYGFAVPNWVVKPESEAVIREKLFNKAIRYTESEVDELPEKVYRTLNYDLSSDQRKKYNDLIGEKDTSENIINKTMAFRQICSGFIKSTETHFKSNPKLDILKEIIDQVIEQHKVVIFHEFIIEGEIIESVFKSMKIKYNALNGRVKDKHKEYTTFQENEKYRAMIAHPLSGGASINLTAASYCIFFSNGHKVIDRMQCEKRIHRAGQKSPRVYYYDIVGKQTIEEKMVENLRNGLDAFGRVLNDKDFIKLLGG